MRSREFDKYRRDIEIVILAHNIRSVQNVGSILRTAECLGAKEVVASGYTPNLAMRTDGSNLPLLPHVRAKLQKELHRSALGAEEIVKLGYASDIMGKILELKSDGYEIVGLEQDRRSVALPEYKPPRRVALLLGEEVHGITPELMSVCNVLVEIPMYGQKESYNVSVACGIALYNLSIETGR